MTGTVITADKPIFVTSGAVVSSVGSLAGPSHLVTYLPPVEICGTDYVVAPVIGRTTGDLLRILGK